LSRFVLDASVAAKWFLPAAGEPYSAEAAQLLAQYEQDKVRFLVPDLFWVEMTSVFWTCVRRNRWTQVEARTALDALAAFEIRTIPARRLLSLAFTIAHTFDRAIYDCVYVALAMNTKSELITADEKLANALAARLPVKWIGAYSLLSA
jgi:predicted nucleic acid-binding protein